MAHSVSADGKRSRGRERVFVAISLLIGTLIGLLLVECAARLGGVRPIVMDAKMFQANADPLLPYRLRPGYQGYFAGGSVTIEPNGWRRIVPEDSSKQPPKYRVLLVGDSGVFGLGLDDQDTIASRLKSMLQSNEIGFDVDAVSAPGYTSWNEYAALRDYEKLNDTRVVVLVYVANDLTYDNDTLKLQEGRMQIAGSSVFHSVMRWIYSNVYISNILIDQIKRLTVKAGSSAPSYFRVEPGALAYSMQALQKMKVLCEEKGAKLIVAIYRDVLIFSHRTLEEDYERAISQALNVQGIPSFILKEHTDKLTIDRARVAWNDPHPSQEAARLIARQIYAELEARDLLQKQAP